MGRPEAIKETAAGLPAEDSFAALACDLQRGAPVLDQLVQVFDAKTAEKDEKITIDKKNFDKIGPKAQGVLDDAGVSEISIRAGKTEDKIEAVLGKPHDIKRDLLKDGCTKLTIDTKFSATMEKAADGTLILKDVKGLTATTLIGVLDITRLELKKNAAGDTEIVSTVAGSVRPPQIVPGADLMKKAETLRDRIKALKPEDLKPPIMKVSYANIPPLFVG